MAPRSGFVWRVIEWTPISGRPVSQDFKRNATIAWLAVVSFLVYAGLTIWNLFTQGKNKVYTSVLLDEFINSGNTSCTARTINLGDNLYARSSGVFMWTVTGIDMSQASTQGKSFMYTGGYLRSNMTLASLTYQFPGQSYTYEVCGNASMPTLQANTSVQSSSQASQSTIVSMCASFDIASSSQNWATTIQQLIENKVYGTSSFLPQLNIASGVIPTVLFPPYSNSSQINDTSVTSERAFDVSVWMGGFSYLPNSAPSTGTENNGFGATHDFVLASEVPGADGSITDLATIFEQTVPGAAELSGNVLSVNGIGSVKLQTTTLNAQMGFTEPPVFTNMRNYTLMTLNLILDMASNDLNEKPLESSYLCTVTSEEWKSPLSLLAMIIGNNGAVFGSVLGFLLTFAAWREKSNEKRDVMPQWVPTAPKNNAQYAEPIFPFKPQMGSGYHGYDHNYKYVQSDEAEIPMLPHSGRGYTQ